MERNENIFAFCKDEFMKVLVSADTYLQRENILATLARDVYERKGRQAPLTDFETAIYGISLTKGDSIFDIVSKLSRIIRPLLKSWSTETKDLLEINIPGISLSVDEEDDIYLPYILKRPSGNEEQIHLTVEEDGYDPMLIHGLKNSAHASGKKTVLYMNGTRVADIADVLSFLTVITQINTVCNKIYEERDSEDSVIDSLFEEVIESLLEKKLRAYEFQSECSAHSTLPLLATDTMVSSLPSRLQTALNDSNRQLIVVDRHSYHSVRDDLLSGSPVSLAGLPDEFLLLSQDAVTLLGVLEAYRQKGQVIAYHDILPCGTKGYGKPFFPMPKKTRWYMATATEQVITELFTVLWELRNQQIRTERYVAELSSTYAKSFMTKANIPMKQLQAMESSLLNAYFGFVEYDEMTDVEAVQQIEREFIAVRESYLPFLDASMASIRFRRLGNHKAAGLYYPFYHCVCVDVRHPHSMIHEIGHMIDYSFGRLSHQLSFNPVKRIYLEHLHNVSESSEGVGAQLKGNSKYNLAYYQENTEIFARCFEVYLAKCKGVQNALLPSDFGWEYATDDASLAVIKEYYDTCFSTLPEVPILVEKVEKEELLDESENVRWLVGTPSNDGNFMSHLNDASLSEVERALSIVRPLPKTVAKVKVLERRLKQLKKIPPKKTAAPISSTPVFFSSREMIDIEAFLAGNSDF